VKKKSANKEEKGNLTVRIPIKQLEHLRKLSHRMSLNESRNVNLNMLTKTALEKTYPMPGEQMNFNFDKDITNDLA
tara:strand:- start:4835 stop:5062 length:228 start_codon:yes stop_codon:yes gene_type:complete